MRTEAREHTLMAVLAGIYITPTVSKRGRLPSPNSLVVVEDFVDTI